MGYSEAELIDVVDTHHWRLGRRRRSSRKGRGRRGRTRLTVNESRGRPSLTTTMMHRGSRRREAAHEEGERVSEAGQERLLELLVLLLVGLAGCR